MNIEIIDKYFPEINVIQSQQIESLYELYHDWNSKINVISRKDIDSLYEHHVLHSLAIAKVLHFKEGSLAIMFPDCSFKLIDGTWKKIRVAQEIAHAIGLKNVVAEHIRGEEEKGKYDFVVSRAVMPLPDLVKIVRKNISNNQRNAMLNGVICLKGGNIDGEIHPFKNTAEVLPIHNWFKEEWYDQKNIIYVPI